MTLKKNSKKILDVYIKQPVKNQTAAYREVHPTASDITARVNSYKLFKKPEAQIYLQEHINRARDTIVDLMASPNERIRLDASTSVLDRELGKPTQRTEQQSTSVNINIDLTQQ